MFRTAFTDGGCSSSWLERQIVALEVVPVQIRSLAPLISDRTNIMDVTQTLSEGLQREFSISITAAQIDERADQRIAFSCY